MQLGTGSEPQGTQRNMEATKTRNDAIELPPIASTCYISPANHIYCTVVEHYAGEQSAVIANAAALSH